MGSDSAKTSPTINHTTINNSTIKNTTNDDSTMKDAKTNDTTFDDLAKNDSIKKGRDRLVGELDKLMNDPDINNCFGVDYWDPENPDVYHWQITLIPPKGTDYEGGFYKLEVQFSEDYPLVAPKMKFLTKIYHCNINHNGHICLNTIKHGWRKSFTMEDILNHIIILLYKQNPGDALDSSAGKLYNESKTKFLEKVKQYVKDYANINDYENLQKQEIPLLKDCKCCWCEDVYPSRE